MANLLMDTSKMRECGRDVYRLSKEFNEVLSVLYNRIGNMPTMTREWIGKSAEEYVALVNNEKKYYLALKNIMEDYAKCLIDDADLLELTLKKIQI